MKMSISFVVAMGMTASLFAGEQDTTTARNHKRVRKEVKVVKDLEVEEIVEFVLPTISDYVTEGGKLVIAGVTSVKHDEQGRTIVEIKSYGDFEEDFVLTIPRPVLYDKQGELIGIQGPDKVRILEDHAVYIFESVDGKGTANKAAPTPSVSSTAQDICRLVFDLDENKKVCLEIPPGACAANPNKPFCRYIINPQGFLDCDCQKAVEE